MRIDVDDLYRKWSRLKEPTLTYISLKGLAQWFERETERRNIDPSTIDFEAFVDPMLSYEENKIILLEFMTGAPSEKEYEDMYKQQVALLEQQVREKYPEVIEPLEERIIELERTETTSKKRYKKIKALQLQLAETEKLLEEERAKPPEVAPIKVRVLRPFTEGILDYTVDSVIETKDLDWVLEKIKRELVERVGVEVPVEIKAPPKPLSTEEVRTLEDEFKAALMGELGRIPRDVLAEFRVTLRKVNLELYEEALRVILEKAKEIVARESLRKAFRPAAVEMPPEREMRRVPDRWDEDERKEDFMIPSRGKAPASVPDYPMSDLPFPRRPTSEEQLKLWDAFAYALQEKGINFWEFRKPFEERIWNITFKDWFMLKDRFTQLVDLIAEGEDLPPLWVWKGVPPPSLEFLWKPTIEPTEAKAQAIRHFTSVVIRNARSTGQVATLDELMVNLDQHGVSDVSYDEIKDAIMMGHESKDVYFTGISLEELTEFLGT